MRSSLSRSLFKGNEDIDGYKCYVSIHSLQYVLHTLNSTEFELEEGMTGENGGAPPEELGASHAWGISHFNFIQQILVILKYILSS